MFICGHSEQYDGCYLAVLELHLNRASRTSRIIVRIYLNSLNDRQMIVFDRADVLYASHSIERYRRYWFLAKKE